MEFNFIINKLVQLDSQGIGIYEPKKLRNRTHTQSEQQLSQVINQMGEKSAIVNTFIEIETLYNLNSQLNFIAQGLKQVITQFDKMLGTDQKLYIAAEGRVCQGILKVGSKNLFYRDMTGSVKEIKPLCVLDFYVHESCQRQGFGKLLFETMLMHEQINPEKLAYDRPSPKLIAFLKKHYNLVKYIPQNNNFVVFDQYFKAPPHSVQQSQQTNPRQISQQFYDYPSHPYPSQQQQQHSNQKSYHYKGDSPSEAIHHSASRNNVTN